MEKNKEAWNRRIHYLFLSKGSRNKFFGQVFRSCISNSPTLENNQNSKQNVINVTKGLLALIGQVISWYNQHKPAVHFYRTLKSQKYYTIYPLAIVKGISLAVIIAFSIESKILGNVTKKTLILNEWFIRSFFFEILKECFY